MLLSQRPAAAVPWEFQQWAHGAKSEGEEGDDGGGWETDAPDQRSGEREASLGAHISIWQRASAFLRHGAPLADQALLS